MPIEKERHGSRSSCGSGFPVLVLAAPAIAGDATVTHSQTAAPTGARFEIVQSTLAARGTYRLDRFSGDVSLLVRTSNDGSAWERMVVRAGCRRRRTGPSSFSDFHVRLSPRDSRSSWTATRVVIWVVTEVTFDDGTKGESMWLPFQGE